MRLATLGMEKTMESWLTLGHMHFIVKAVSYRVSIDQADGRIEETHELFVSGDRLGEEIDIPDGTQVVLHIKGCSAEYEKDEAGNVVLGYLPKRSENVWLPELWVRNETMREIRDSFRHWQNTKAGDAFVWITLSSKPEDAGGAGHVLVRGIRLSIPEAGKLNTQIAGGQQPASE